MSPDEWTSGHTCLLPTTATGDLVFPLAQLFHLSRTKDAGRHVTRGVGLASRPSEDFALPSDWIVEEVRSGSTTKLRYRSPSGRFFKSSLDVQEFLALPQMAAMKTGDPDVPSASASAISLASRAAITL